MKNRYDLTFNNVTELEEFILKDHDELHSFGMKKGGICYNCVAYSEKQYHKIFFDFKRILFDEDTFATMSNFERLVEKFSIYYHLNKFGTLPDKSFVDEYYQSFTTFKICGIDNLYFTEV